MKKKKCLRTQYTVNVPDFFGLCARSQSNCAYSGWQVKTVPWEINWYLFFSLFESVWLFVCIFHIKSHDRTTQFYSHISAVEFISINFFVAVVVFLSVLGHCCLHSPRKFKLQQKSIIISKYVMNFFKCERPRSKQILGERNTTPTTEMKERKNKY